MDNKKCCTCDMEKPLSEFHKDKRRIDGLFPRCKNCRTELETINKGEKRIYYREPELQRKERRKIYMREYAKNNRKSLFLYHKKYKEINREKLNVYLANYMRNRSSDDINFKLIKVLRHRLWSVLNYRKWQKNIHLKSYLGCTGEQLITHIESQFKDGMTWADYGNGVDKFNIDHIIPLASAKTEEELYKLCHYTNLQPLWQPENSRKDISVRRKAA